MKQCHYYEQVLPSRGQMADAQSQETLNRSRERLLLSREDVRISGSAIRKKRHEAGAAEADFMSHLRKYILVVRKERLPDKLWTAFGRVQSLRDALGELEDHHIAKETELDKEEWEFMEQETEFYLSCQEWPLPPPPPSILPPSMPPLSRPPPSLAPPSQHPPTLLLPPTLTSIPAIDTRTTASSQQWEAEQHAQQQQLRRKSELIAKVESLERQLRQLRQKFEELRQNEAQQLEEKEVIRARNDSVCLEGSLQSELFKGHLELVNDMMDCEVEPLKAKVANALESSVGDAESLDSASTPQDEPSVYKPKAMKRVLDWTTDCLRENPVQRTMQKNVLENCGFHHTKEEEWINGMGDYWSHDGVSERAIDGLDERVTKLHV